MTVTSPISIHALLAESDARIIDPTFGQEVFLSTLSLRRATIAFEHPAGLICISIHALLAESDAHLVHARNFRHLISIHALLAESDHMVALTTFPA